MKDSAVSPVIKDFLHSQKDIKIDGYSKGGFGELYFGKRLILGDRVALKFYHLDDYEGKHVEPLLLKKITHENILPIYDAKVIDNNIAYYLTPEISGGDLQNIIDKYILKTDVAINIIQGVLKGLNELHKDPRNLVHRDLKTLNILIDANTGKPYLADFGSVKQIPSGDKTVNCSRYSLLYCPAEAILKDEYCKESDIYQVGIILYQALGGFFPLDDPQQWFDKNDKIKFEALGKFDKSIYMHNLIRRLITSGRIINLSSLPPFIGKRLIRIIKTATSIDLNKRYNNCSEFLKDLYNYQKNAKSWWYEKKIIHAYCPKQKVSFRIVKRGNQLIVESKKQDTDWRRKKMFNEVNEAIKYIEQL